MPVTLELREGAATSQEARFEDAELQAAWVAREDRELASRALHAYIVRRLAEERGVEPVGRDDNDTVRRLLTHWLEGLAETTGAIQVVSIRGGRDGPPNGQPGNGHRHDQTLRE